MKNAVRVALYALLPTLCVAQIPDTIWARTVGRFGVSPGNQKLFFSTNQ